MMKNKEMRKENVLLWPLFYAYLFCFPFCRKTHAWIPRKYDVLSNCFKIQQLQLSIEKKSTFFAAPEVMTEFSAAWCLSIVSQGAKATYIRTQSTQYNFASFRIVEGSAGGVVAASELKAVELDFFSTSNWIFSPRWTASVLAFCNAGYYTLELELFNCVLFHRTKFEFSFFFTVTVL